MIRAYVPLIAKRVYALRKLQRGLTAMELWCEGWNIKISEEKSQAIYFSHWRTPVEAFLTFANDVRYLGVIFDKKITWKLHTETIATKALRIFLSIYPILKSERLSVGAKLIYKAPAGVENCPGLLPSEIVTATKQSPPPHL
jgi:hypothetical protein